MPVDPNEPTYCLCNQVSYGEMIGCDNPDVSYRDYNILIGTGRREWLSSFAQIWEEPCLLIFFIFKCEINLILIFNF